MQCLRDVLWASCVSQTSGGGGQGWGRCWEGAKGHSLTCRALRSSSAGDWKHICSAARLSLWAVVARGTELTVFP